MLGIRIAAMAIRGWQALLDDPLPVFSYSSHEWLARRQLTLGTPPPFHVISDARRNHWNVTSVLEPGVVSPVRQILAEEIPHLPGPLYRMEEIVRAQPPIPVREMLLYDLKEDPALFLEPNFARFTEIPDALILAGPEYKKWTAERHR